jgi:large subunit ribosomal protein L25
MEFAKLTATKRKHTGKGQSRRMRRDGRVPAVIYGPGVDTLAISVAPADLTQALSGPLSINTVLKIQIDGVAAKDPKEVHAIVRDHQYHPVRRDLLHVDFLVIDPDKPVKIDIPLITKGRSLGEQEGGTLTQHYRMIPVECVPANIPVSIAVEVGELQLNGHVHVRDLVMPQGVTIGLAPEISLITVLAPRAEVEEEEKPEEEGLEGEAAEGAEEAEGAEGAEGAPPADGATADKPAEPDKKKQDKKKQDKKKR